MRFNAMDILNAVVGVLAVISTLTGMLSGMYTGAIITLVVSWLGYHRIPWAHKGWNSENILKSVKPFYSFSKTLHAGITYALVALIFTSLLVGFVAKSGPSVLAKDAAEYVWANNAWNTKTIKSSTIPPEFVNAKREDQPFVVIVDGSLIKAAPLQESLSSVVEKYNGIYVQMGSVLFLVVLVTCIVLYPTEMLAEARTKKDEDG